MAENLKPTDILREDHKIVLEKLDVMADAIKNLGKPATLPILEKLVSFLGGEVVVHFSKEEEALFPEIEKFIPREGGPTGMMFIEHEDLNNAKANFIKGVSELSKDANSKNVKNSIIENGEHFITLLREHIYKEDSILFMMAEMHMDESQADAISKLFDEIDKKYLVEKSRG